MAYYHRHEENPYLVDDSKSQRKREMDALQDLGMDIAALPIDRLKKMTLPDDLRAAIMEYRRIEAHGARKRQAQFIGKIMRQLDPEPLVKQLSIVKGESAEHTQWLHALEAWRERLMAEDQALVEFIAQHRPDDVQTLRTHIRNARKEKEQNKPPKSYRLIFQILKDTIADPSILDAEHDDSNYQE